MARLDVIEGFVNDALWYHYDAGGDVLYLRLSSAREVNALGEETDEGLILLRDQATDQAIGLTIVNWWKRFGHGSLPDSIRELSRQIEPWGRRVAA